MLKCGFFKFIKVILLQDSDVAKIMLKLDKRKKEAADGQLRY